MGKIGEKKERKKLVVYLHEKRKNILWVVYHTMKRNSSQSGQNFMAPNLP